MTSQAWMAYFDASALVKRYAAEPGTPLINEVFRLLPPASRACSVIGLAEVTSVLVRKRNDGRIDRRFFEQASLKLGEEFLAEDEVLIASVDDDLVFASLPLIERRNLNATDAVILRSALDTGGELQSSGRKILLITADKRLLRAARSEELAVVDPEVVGVEELRDRIEGRVR